MLFSVQMFFFSNYNKQLLATNIVAITALSYCRYNDLLVSKRKYNINIVYCWTRKMTSFCVSQVAYFEIQPAVHSHYCQTDEDVQYGHQNVLLYIKWKKLLKAYRNDEGHNALSL